MHRDAPSGFDAVPALQWGSHFGQLYETDADLRDLLVPYFKAGLENNESCFWVTGAPLRAEDARTALRAVVPDLDAREKRRQIEIRDADDWYDAADTIKPQDIVADLLRREAEALRRGYLGLRTNGNCAWVGASQWDDFQAYEGLVQKAVRGRRMICMCSYCLDHSQTTEMLDISGRHDFMLPRRRRAIPFAPA
jgi:MEDS: MEthanogen/methylotroph, DcmR Sensory domain